MSFHKGVQVVVEASPQHGELASSEYFFFQVQWKLNDIINNRTNEGVIHF